MYWFACINVMVFVYQCIGLLVIVYWCSGYCVLMFWLLACCVSMFRETCICVAVSHGTCFVSGRFRVGAIYCRVVLCFQQAINLDPGYLDPGCRFPGQVIVIVKRQWDFRSTYASQGNSSRWAPDSVDKKRRSQWNSSRWTPDSVDKKRRGRPVAFVIVVPVAATVATITNH